MSGDRNAFLYILYLADLDYSFEKLNSTRPKIQFHVRTTQQWFQAWFNRPISAPCFKY